MKWIKLEDKLPTDEDQHYLIYDGHYIRMGLIDNGILKCLEYMEIINASHWMHLPAFPSEE